MRGDVRGKFGLDKRDLFAPSAVDPGYVIPTPQRDAASHAFASSPLAASALKALAGNADLAPQLATGRDFALPLDQHGKGIAAIFITLRDAMDKPIGYVMRVEKAPEIANLNRVYLIYGGLGALLLLLGSGAAVDADRKLTHLQR